MEFWKLATFSSTLILSFEHRVSRKKRRVIQREDALCESHDEKMHHRLRKRKKVMPQDNLCVIYPKNIQVSGKSVALVGEEGSTLQQKSKRKFLDWTDANYRDTKEQELSVKIWPSVACVWRFMFILKVFCGVSKQWQRTLSPPHFWWELAMYVYVLYQYCIRCLLSDIYFVPSRSCSRLFYSFSLSLVPTHPHLCTLDKKSMHGKRQEQEHTNYCFCFCFLCLVWFGYRYRASKSS